MKTIDKVELLLQQDQLYRDNDKELLLAYWQSEGFHLSDSQRWVFLSNCTTAETITRARRALKEKYPASESVDNARFEKYRQYRFNQQYRIAED